MTNPEAPALAVENAFEDIQAEVVEDLREWAPRQGPPGTAVVHREEALDPQAKEFLGELVERIVDQS